MSVPAAPSAPRAPVVRDTRAAGLRAAAGLLAGVALLVIINAGAIALRVPRPHGGAGLRALHHAFDAAETLGVGAIWAAIVGVYSGAVRLPVWATTLIYTAATAPLLHLAFDEQLYRQACVLFDGRFMTLLYPALSVITSFGISVAHLVGAYLSRFPWIRPVPVVIAAGGLVANHLHLADDYFSIHCGLAWISITLAGASIAPLAERALLALVARPRGRVALGVAAIIALLGLVVPPSNAVRFELFRQPVAVAPWVLAATVWRAPRPRSPAPLPASRWFEDRRDAPPVPPTRERPTMPAGPVVVLITIDATRADAINDPANDAIFPTFAEMKRRGAWFPNATSPGGQTAVSLTTAFSGRSFSELGWTWHGQGQSRFRYAADDPAPRYPKLLAEAGVKTASVCSINFLANEFGVARGFREEKVVVEGRRHGFARQVIDPLVERIRRVGPEPLFAWAHLMEPHAPYDRGRKDGTNYERYLSEIAVADTQVGRVLRALEGRLASRGVLIVSADHGEAFGEHETTEHTKTLYDELLRVPLLVRGAGVVAARHDERVGLVDVGPTVLDLFGQPTPATYEAQSLAPLLWGRAAKLDRPLLAEGRLRRALYTEDGLKVIADPRRKLVEVYDLTRDPGELDNLWDKDPARSDRALSALDAFFAKHTKGTPPYKP